MRKSDKKKNMGKANLIAETRYFESKGMLVEDESQNPWMGLQKGDKVRITEISGLFQAWKESKFLRDDWDLKPGSVLTVGWVGEAEGSSAWGDGNKCKLSNCWKNIPMASFISETALAQKLTPELIQFEKISKDTDSMNEMEPMLENSGNVYDLRNGDNVEDLLWKIRTLMGSYVGTDKTADAGMANDNKVIIANLIKSGKLGNFLSDQLTNKTELHKVGYAASDDPMISAGKGIWSNDHEAMRNFMLSVDMNPDEYKIVSRDELK